MPTAHDIRRPYKRPPISDQQKRREASLRRQEQNRRDAQLQARCLASTVLSLQSETSTSEFEPEQSQQSIEVDNVPEYELESTLEDLQEGETRMPRDITDVHQASKLKGHNARQWFASQLMVPEWMIDVPDNLSQDWYVLSRPAGKRCFVVATNGTTVSRLRNGSVLHHFPSALPSGARTKYNSGSSQSYCILDCIFHEIDQTYYVLDMVCWRGYSLYDCTAEFRFYWLNSKLSESGACEAPSNFHRYRFCSVPIYNCDQSGLVAAYSGDVPYVKDGLLFYNKHSNYQSGNTPLTLVWKDEKCSDYVIDTDNKGDIPSQQQVVLELRTDGKLTTSDDPPVKFGFLDDEFIQKSGLRPGNLLRFAITDGGLSFVGGELENADIKYVGKCNRARVFADSYSKVIFQYMARHAPLRVHDLLASVSSFDNQDGETHDVEMDG